jgi:heme/copper-type cytochrome/quinol oxidase subunit 2
VIISYLNDTFLILDAVLSTTNEEVAMITTGTISGSILLVVIVFMVVCLCLKCRAQKNSNLNSKKRSRYTKSYIQNVYNI